MGWGMVLRGGMGEQWGGFGGGVVDGVVGGVGWVWVVLMGVVVGLGVEERGGEVWGMMGVGWEVSGMGVCWCGWLVEWL